MANWVAPERNFDGVAFERVRKLIDDKINKFHDALSEHYYKYIDLPNGEKPNFIYNNKNFGVLNKEKFDKLHGMIFNLHDIAIVLANNKLPSNLKYSENEINPVMSDGKTKLESTQESIQKLKTEGYELSLSLIGLGSLEE